MNKEFKREYKWNNNIYIEPSVGLGLAIGNVQPKKKYHTAWWTLNILFVCWRFELRLSYNYKK